MSATATVADTASHEQDGADAFTEASAPGRPRQCAASIALASQLLAGHQEPCSAQKLSPISDLHRGGRPVEPLHDMLNMIFGRAAAASDHEQGELTVCLGDTARKLATAVVECVRHELLCYVAKLVSRAAALVTGSSAVPDADGWSHLRRLAVVFDGLLEVLLKGTPMEVRP